MILLMDRIASEEATELRERILRKGLPCAASFSPFDTTWLPHAHCVLTTQGGYSTVRAYLASDRYADLPVFVVAKDTPDKVYLTDTSPGGAPIGKTLPLVDALLPYIGPDVKRRRGIPSLFFLNGFVISPMQLYYRITSLNLTERERRILQFFLFHPDEPQPCHRIAICSLSNPAPVSTVKEADSIRNAVCSINRKTAKAVGMRFLYRVNKCAERSYCFRMP